MLKRTNSPIGIKYSFNGHSISEGQFNWLLENIKTNTRGYGYGREFSNMAGVIGCVETQSWWVAQPRVGNLSRRRAV